MGKGTDLARQIVEMSREYNRHIEALYRKIDGLRDEIKYQKDRADNQKDNYNKNTEKLEKTLETVTDIICHDIHTCQAGDHYITLWEDEEAFKRLIKALGITLDVSKREREDKENED